MEKRLIFNKREIFSVGFFGLGESNLKLFDYLKAEFPSLSFTLRSDGELRKCDGFDRVFTGESAFADINEDILFLSPSVRRDRHGLKAAEAAGVILSSEIELFYKFKNIPVISVTGSDGKSSTVALASRMLSGTLGKFPPTANSWSAAVELLSDQGAVGAVAELSSFQLMGFYPRSRRSLITSISENHLDFHVSFSEYTEAKARIHRDSDERVFNLDCEFSRGILQKYPLPFAVYSASMSYGEMKSICDAMHYLYVEDGVIYDSAEPIIAVKEILYSGGFRTENFLAALALTRGLVSERSVYEAARGFTGLSHRCELVHSCEGIEFYDSSVDTTPTRTRATLTALKKPTVLILGGRSKGVSYSSLLPLPKTVKAIVITGENADEIKSALLRSPAVITGRTRLYIDTSFDLAVLRAAAIAKCGDAVLLSPASTSYDEFSSYKERAERFTELIKKNYPVR